MSLTRVVADRTVARKLDTFVPAVSMAVDANVLVPSRVPDYRVVGTAFDYALRMELARTQRGVVQGPWIAEKSAAILFGDYAFPRTATASAYWGPFASKAIAIVQDARGFIERTRGEPRTQVVHEELASHALLLARLDAHYRAGYIVPGFARCSRGEIEEVVALLSIVPFERFRARRVVCNPSLDLGAATVGGADADLLIGTRLIDVKTVTRSTVDRAWVRQLIGYLILARRTGLLGAEVRRLEVYFARHATFWSIDARSIAGHRGFRALERWFHSEAPRALRRARQRR